MPDRTAHRYCVVTGGTAGIGFVTARALAEQGDAVLVVGRNRERGMVACRAINESCGSARAEFYSADLSDLVQVRALANTIAARWPHVNVLVNNAGGMFGSRLRSAQGLEMSFALNHLSYFALSLLLLPALAAAPGRGRILNVASEAHRIGALDFADLQAERHYRGWRAYCASKLANLLFTQELARRVDRDSVAVSALHPGFVATDIGTRHGLMPRWLWRVAILAALSPEEGARTSIYLATTEDTASVHGRYFVQRRPAEPAAAARDSLSAARLWDESLRLTGLSPRL